MIQLRTGLLVASALVMATGCGLFGGGGSKGPSEEELASRVSLSALDQKLEPDASQVSTTVMIPPAVDVSSWPQAGRQANKEVGHVAAGTAMQVDWRVNAGTGSGRKQRIVAAPVIENGRVFVVDADQEVRGFDASSGGRLWSVKLTSDSKRDDVSVGAGIASAGDRLIVTSGFGYIVALSAEDGSEIWKRVIDNPISGSAAILGGRAYVTSTNNEIYALSLSTGEVLWADQAIAESARILSSPSPAVNDDIAVAPFSSGELIAYVPANGRRLWQDTLTTVGRFTPLSAINDIAGRPTLQDGVVYAASHSGLLAAIDARSGTRIWAKRIGSRMGPAVAGNFLFIVGTEGQVACLNKIDGSVVWVRQLQGFEDEDKRQKPIVWTGPLVASDRLIVVSSQGEVVALSLQTGETVSELNVKQPVYIEPIAVDGRMFVLTDEGTLIAIR